MRYAPGRAARMPLFHRALTPAEAAQSVTAMKRLDFNDAATATIIFRIERGAQHHRASIGLRDLLPAL